MAKAQPVEIGGIAFPKKGDARNYLRSMLNRYGLEEHVSLEDENFLRDALRNHPDSKEKIGVGVNYFVVRRADYGTRCFWIRRSDGSEMRFSYKKCI